MASTKDKFDLAVKIVQNLPKDGPIQQGNDTKLKFYSYYKIATVGKCNTTQPWAIQVVERAKWDAWNGCGDMPADEAMAKYVDEFAALLKSSPEYDGDDSALKADMAKFKNMTS